MAQLDQLVHRRVHLEDLLKYVEMKIKQEPIDFHTHVRVADTSKLIKKIKTEKVPTIKTESENGFNPQAIDAMKPTEQSLKKQRLVGKAKKMAAPNADVSSSQNGALKKQQKKIAKAGTKAKAIASGSTKPVKKAAEKAGELDADAEANTSQSELKEEDKPREQTVKGRDYTLFVGNLPPTATAQTTKTMFKKYGKILTIRFRTNSGQMISSRREMKKVSSLICYIRFSDKEEMEKACEMDGHTFDGNRIRVTRQDEKQMGNAKSTVFVGNVRRGTSENELYSFFSSVGEIEYVRLIATRNVGFVCFKKGVAINKAIKLDGQKLNDRPLRVMRVDPQKTTMKKNKKGHLVKKNKLPSGSGEGENAPNDFHGNVVAEKTNKRKKASKREAGKVKKVLSMKLKAAMNVSKK